CDPETGSLRVKKNDLLILATDGMYKMVGLDEILTLLTGDTTLEEKIEALMSAALAAGGTDNITIVLARV
ncbi:MAG: SpoIIE family protein phosphatase, partial [Desulfobacterium sp.]|nr:SpoIIE family protein phosphatase [Desulfobacterium sp.]